ncbi:MAG: hypothetical protein ACI3ZQ_06035 [Candidatus Cryptobacteroides sp.]
MANLNFTEQTELVSLLFNQLIDDCEKVGNEPHKRKIYYTALGPSAMHDKIVRLRNELLALDKALKEEERKW